MVIDLQVNMTNHCFPLGASAAVSNGCATSFFMVFNVNTLIMPLQGIYI